MGLFKFVFSKSFLKHFGLAILIGLTLLMGVYFWLDHYTHHGEDIEVPDFSGKLIPELDDAFKGTQLKYLIVDSSAFDDKLPKGAVVEQSPRAASKVKEGRTIYLTINPVNPPKKAMPDLVDLTLRQAIAKLEDHGFKLGGKNYVPDIAKDAVLGQQYKGEDIKPGEKLPIGSKVDLILGDGLKDNKVYLTYVVNMTIEEAKEAINLASLDLGVVIPDKTIGESKEDTLKARIFKQRPEFNPRAMVPVGEPIDIWITLDSTIIKYDPNIRLMADSIRKSAFEFSSKDSIN